MSSCSWHGTIDAATDVLAAVPGDRGPRKVPMILPAAARACIMPTICPVRSLRFNASVVSTGVMTPMKKDGTKNRAQT